MSQGMLTMSADMVRAVGLPPDGGVIAIDKSFCVQLGIGRRDRPWPSTELRELVDEMAHRSMKAQRIGQPVSDVAKVISGLGDETIYLQVICNGEGTGVVSGILKTGAKKLYIQAPRKDGLTEVNPRCVLDFYVHEGVQRSGFGISLFQEMMYAEGIGNPAKFGYDRPSAKFMKFLAKHFGLKDYESQVNHFVVFKKYFSEPNCKPQTPRRIVEERERRAAAEQQAAEAAQEDPEQIQQQHVQADDRATPDMETNAAPEPVEEQVIAAAAALNRSDGAKAAVAAVSYADSLPQEPYKLRTPWATVPSALDRRAEQPRSLDQIYSHIPDHLRDFAAKNIESTPERRLSVEERQHRREMAAIQKEIGNLNMPPGNRRFR